MPNGLATVDVARRSRGRLRIKFIRPAGRGNGDDRRLSESKGRDIVGRERIKRFAGRTRSFTWNGRRGDHKAPNGVYVVRVSVKDAAGRTDTRRVVVQKKKAASRRRAPSTWPTAA